MKSWQKPTDETVEKALASVKKEIDRQYFFSRLRNPLWVQPLAERGYFNSQPQAKYLPDGSLHMPFWPELQYLQNITRDVPEEVVNILSSLPKVDNRRIHAGIFDMALELPVQHSARLRPKVLECATGDPRFIAHRFSRLLARWVEEAQISAALELADVLVRFEPDPQLEHKRNRYLEHGLDWIPPITPVSKLDEREYRRVFEIGIRPLAENEPDAGALILADTAEEMIRLRKQEESQDEASDEDYSEAWCRRLGRIDDDYEGSSNVLIEGLTFACERVFEKGSGSATGLAGC